MSAAKIEEMVQRKVEEVLAARALSEAGKQQRDVHSSNNELNEQVQRRLELLEQRIEGKEDARAEGLSYLLMGKQHQSRGEDASALRMYQLAQPFFPSNEKLEGKIKALKEKLKPRSQVQPLPSPSPMVKETLPLEDTEAKPEAKRPRKRKRYAKDDSFNSEYYVDEDEEYQPSDANEQFSDDDIAAPHPHTQQSKRPAAPNTSKSRKPSYHTLPRPSSFSTSKKETNTSINDEPAPQHTPRTAHILSIVNTRNISQIKLLRGVGIKKAEAIVDCLCEIDTWNTDENNAAAGAQVQIQSLAELGRMKGVGMKTVENMRQAI